MRAGRASKGMCCVAVLLLAGCGPAWEDAPPPLPVAPPDPEPMAALPVALQTVTNKVMLPSSASAFALDLDGNGVPDNQFGKMLAFLQAAYPGLDLQGELDRLVDEGKLLVLQELRARSLSNDPAIETSVFFGHDPDGNPGNNFSGAAVLAPAGSESSSVAGHIHGGHMATEPGDLVIPIPLGRSFVAVKVTRGRIQAEVDPSGMASGVVAGAVSFPDVQGRVLPVLAAELNAHFTNPSISAKGKAILSQLFDLNGSGTITPDELSACPAADLLLGSADVDTDGDGKPDAISVGLGFTAVPTTILRTSPE
jgi:hypothetical protein